MTEVRRQINGGGEQMVFQGGTITGRMVPVKKSAPVQYVPIKRDVVSETGPVTIPMPAGASELLQERGTGLPDPISSQYTTDQIRAMLARGEVNERGEPEGGLGPDFELERQAREAAAGAEFARNANGTPPPGDTPAGDNAAGLLLAAALGYFLLGG